MGKIPQINGKKRILRMDRLWIFYLLNPRSLAIYVDLSIRPYRVAQGQANGR